MRFTNTGGLPHEFAFARVEEGKTEADIKAVIDSGEEPPAWAEDVAGVPGLSPGQSITATDNGLQVPALTSGEQTVEFENGGTKPHELVLSAFEPGKGIKDVDRWFGSGYQGEPPVTFLGGMQTIPADESVFLTIDLEPGADYTAVDFTTKSRETFTVS